MPGCQTGVVGRWCQEDRIHVGWSGVLLGSHVLVNIKDLANGEPQIDLFFFSDGFTTQILGYPILTNTRVGVVENDESSCLKLPFQQGI